MTASSRLTFTCLAFAAIFASSPCPLNAAEKPNFIVILTDDLGYGDFGCYGAKDIATPQIDRMAREGVKLTSFYVAPVCSPTRAALMTGSVAQRVGIGGVLFPRNTVGLNLEEKTLPELLKAQGYAAALIGKWHLGFQPSQTPTHHGFDHWYGTLASHSSPLAADEQTHAFAKDCVFRDGHTLESVKESKVDGPLLRNNEIIEVPADPTQFTQRYTREAIRFITENKEKPFFLYLAHNMPHIPLHASEAFRGKSGRGLYGDVIQELDWGVGEVLRALKDLGLDENTLVILTSDNGPKREAGGSAGVLRGAKGSSFEGGVRVPCIARWPGKIPAGRASDEPLAITDILPTLVRLAGGERPTDRVIDGRDAWPVWSGADGAKSPHEAIYYLAGRSIKGIRIGDWKYLVEEAPEKEAPKVAVELTPDEQKLSRKARNALIKERSMAASQKRGPAEALFNLREDIGEQRTRIAEHPDVVRRLKGMMERFHQDLRQNGRPAGSAE